MLSIRWEKKHFDISKTEFDNLITKKIKWHNLVKGYAKSGLDRFEDYLAQMRGQKSGARIFQDCQLITSPKLGRDFGLSAEIRPGVIDTIKADYLSKAAQSNAYIRDLADELQIRHYRNCMADYGAIIGSAYLVLTQDLNDLKISVKKAEDNTITVSGLGYEDVLTLAKSALDRAIAGGAGAPSIARIRDRVTSEQSPCRFDRSLENIQCGSTLIILGTKPQLVASGIKWYGDGSYAGYAGTYKLSRSWSLSDAIEQLKTTERYSKFASEVAKYTEGIETHGKTKEATWAKKKALSLSEGGKQDVGTGKIVPSVH